MQTAQLLGVGGLRPQGDAVHPRPAQAGDGAPVHAVGVALHGDLRLAADGKDPLDEHQQLPQALLPIVGGGPAAEIDGVRHPALQAGRKRSELGDEGLLIVVHFLFPPGQGVEVTVVTFTFAEGDVDIDAVCGGHRVPSYPA